MDKELVSANQRINDMSFKDLTSQAAAAMKPNPAKTAKTPAKENEPKTAGKEKPTESKTS